MLTLFSNDSKEILKANHYDFHNCIMTKNHVLNQASTFFSQRFRLLQYLDSSNLLAEIVSHPSLRHEDLNSSDCLACYAYHQLTKSTFD